MFIPYDDYVSRTGSWKTAWETGFIPGADLLPKSPPYKVGPGHPPKDHQFKKGQSGNPSGRRKAVGASFHMEAVKYLLKPTKITIDHKPCMMTNLQVILMQLIEAAKKSNLKAAEKVFAILKEAIALNLISSTTGLLNEEKLSPKQFSWSEEQAILYKKLEQWKQAQGEISAPAEGCDSQGEDK
jgi:hypothetical protein